MERTSHYTYTLSVYVVIYIHILYIYIYIYIYTVYVFVWHLAHLNNWRVDIQVWFFRMPFLKLGVQEDSDVTGNVPEIIRIQKPRTEDAAKIWQLFSHLRHPFNSF